MSAFVRNVCCYYIREAEQIIKSRPYSSTYLVNPIKVNYIKKDRDWYASVSVDVKYTTSRGSSSERSSEIKIFSKDDKDKAVNDIIRMFYNAVKLVHNDLINHINGGFGNMKKLDLSITLITNKEENLQNSISLNKGKEEYILNIIFTLNEYTGKQFDTLLLTSNSFLFVRWEDAMNFSSVVDIAYRNKAFEEMNFRDIDRVLSLMYEEAKMLKINYGNALDVANNIKENIF